MLVRIAKPSDVRSSEITPRRWTTDRRGFLAGLGGAGLIGWNANAWAAARGAKIENVAASRYRIADPPTDADAVSGYTNFIEFGFGKDSAAQHARDFVTRPWTVRVEGEVAKPATFDIDDLMKMFPLEERIHRHRCVETWAMVIPWVGFPLAGLLAKVEPNSRAKYVVFNTLLDPTRMPGQNSRLVKWPYQEALRIDEAMNPLALLAVGTYGEVLPNANGAPIRLVVPWKYGFKGIKSIVRIALVEARPHTSWHDLQPDEYGFFANVNPTVDHPRWSQKRERRIGEFLRRDTLMFNGYADEVASLYAGMDLKANY